MDLTLLKPVSLSNTSTSSSSPSASTSRMSFDMSAKGSASSYTVKVNLLYTPTEPRSKRLSTDSKSCTCASHNVTDVNNNRSASNSRNGNSTSPSECKGCGNLGGCKHVAALLLYLRDCPELFLMVLDMASGDGGLAGPSFNAIAADERGVDIGDIARESKLGKSSKITGQGSIGAVVSGNNVNDWEDTQPVVDVGKGLVKERTKHLLDMLMGTQPDISDTAKTTTAFENMEDEDEATQIDDDLMPHSPKLLGDVDTVVASEIATRTTFDKRKSKERERETCELNNTEKVDPRLSVQPAQPVNESLVPTSLDQSWKSVETHVSSGPAKALHETESKGKDRLRGYGAVLEDDGSETETDELDPERANVKSTNRDESLHQKSGKVDVTCADLTLSSRKKESPPLLPTNDSDDDVVIVAVTKPAAQPTVEKVSIQPTSSNLVKTSSKYSRNRSSSPIPIPIQPSTSTSSTNNHVTIIKPITPSTTTTIKPKPTKKRSNSTSSNTNFDDDPTEFPSIRVNSGPDPRNPFLKKTSNCTSFLVERRSGQRTTTGEVYTESFFENVVSRGREGGDFDEGGLERIVEEGEGGGEGGEGLSFGKERGKEVIGTRDDVDASLSPLLGGSQQKNVRNDSHVTTTPIPTRSSFSELELDGATLPVLAEEWEDPDPESTAYDYEELTQVDEPSSPILGAVSPIKTTYSHLSSHIANGGIDTTSQPSSSHLKRARSPPLIDSSAQFVETTVSVSTSLVTMATSSSVLTRPDSKVKKKRMTIDEIWDDLLS
ncbi:hypothetical protein HDU76_002427 [Blyttiomyces sp. JEL0837]|nr:hypothetical protein HDU76_002427 [Blyttiomyces sp. JEL0837]